MFNRGLFNIQQFDAQEKEPEIFIREIGRETVGAETAVVIPITGAAAGEEMIGASANVIVTVPEAFAAEGLIGASAPELIPTIFGTADALERIGASCPKIALVISGGGLNNEKLRRILLATGYAVAYDHFISDPALPFILFMRRRSPNLYADNRVFQKVNRWQILLCTEKKSPAVERVLESVLDEFDIPYEIADETYIKDERLYQIIYEIEELEV